MDRLRCVLHRRLAPDMTVEALVQDKVLTIGENIKIRLPLSATKA
ncbi:MAG: hypothetical protein ACLT1K_09540 [[Clostridium] leptum]